MIFNLLMYHTCLIISKFNNFMLVVLLKGLIKRKVHTFSISKYVDVLNKLERTKKPAGQKLFLFSYSK